MCLAGTRIVASLWKGCLQTAHRVNVRVQLPSSLWPCLGSSLVKAFLDLILQVWGVGITPSRTITCIKTSAFLQRTTLNRAAKQGPSSGALYTVESIGWRSVRWQDLHGVVVLSGRTQMTFQGLLRGFLVVGALSSSPGGGREFKPQDWRVFQGLDLHVLQNFATLFHSLPSKEHWQN